MGNTGYKGWKTLEEYNLDTGEPTGKTKPNKQNDPDYVAPVYDTSSCPIPTSVPIFTKPLTFTRGFNNIIIYWQVTDDIGIESQTVYYKKLGEASYTSKIINATDRSFYLSRLLEGEYYEFYVIACDGDGLCTESEPIRVRTNMRLTLITLSRGYNSNSPCTGTTSTYYIDGLTISNSTMVYSTSNGSSTAPPGYYSDGSSWRYWTGSTWITMATPCGSFVIQSLTTY